MKGLISVFDLKKDEVEEILRLAKEFKEGRKEKIEASAVLFFAEPSTRTRLSFEKSARELGIETYNVSSSESSTVKGESFYDTLKTFEGLGFEYVVFRVPFVLFPYESIVNSLSLRLINAGDGTHQHPSQGIIDLFTLKEHFGELRDLKILYVGDIKHSRVFRSGAPLFTMFGAKVSVSGPRTLIPRDIEVFKVERVFDNVDEGIEWADVVIWLRLQKERQRDNFIPSETSYFRQFGLTKERYERVRYYMHPGPVNRNVDIDYDLVYTEKSLIYIQVKNSIHVRKAIYRFLWNG
ncbi:MAG TPA: aspartate carbamoyltransferase catalytic subunit [Aquificaceae bacterium]|nr:aspartate carbamoyltransferase catalytic subunit [Aquificaceae bacterium]HIQ49119.1 aspartate carbamoyltransferase catalytic subunit [Aquifex aeolicus]